MAATKTKRSRKSSAKKSGGSSKKKSGISRKLENVPFNPGDKVAVHHAHDVLGEQQYGREPIADELSTATVSKDGTLSINVPEKGMYAVSGPDPRREGKTAYLTVGVTTD